MLAQIETKMTKKWKNSGPSCEIPLFNSTTGPPWKNPDFPESPDLVDTLNLVAILAKDFENLKENIHNFPKK